MTTPPVQEHKSLAWGYVWAVLLPLVGVIYGCARWKDGGAAVVVASVVAWVVWTMILLR